MLEQNAIDSPGFGLSILRTDDGDDGLVLNGGIYVDDEGDDDETVPLTPRSDE